MTNNLININFISENMNKFDNQICFDKVNKITGKETTNVFENKLEKTIKTIDDLMKRVKKSETKNENKNIGDAISTTLNHVLDEVLSELVPKIDKTSTEDTETTEENSTNDETALAENLLLLPNNILKIENTKTDDTNQLKILNENIEKISETQETEKEVIIEEELNLMEEIDLTNSIEKNTNNENSLNDIIDNEILDDLNIEFVDANTDFSDENSMMQRQSPEEYGIKAILNKDANVFELNIQKNNVNNSISKGIETNSEKLIQEIIKQMDSLKSGSKINMILNPESLGKINIQLINSKDGLTAHLTVTTNEAKDLLMKGMDGLKDNLLAHGVNVDNLSIKVSENEKETYNQDFTQKEGSRGGNKEHKEPEKENTNKELFEKTFEKSINNENDEF